MATSVTQDARKKANLRVLQRADSSVLDICGSATHVVLYEFLEELQQWEKKQVEGSLFLIKRSDAPRFQLVILNRNSTENWNLNINPSFQMHDKPSFQMQDKPPYLIFRQCHGDDNCIQGIWFHDDVERTTIANLLERVVKSLEHVPDLEQPQQPSPASIDSDAATSALMSPLSLHNSSNTSPSSQQQQSPLVLDKKSLQLSLLSLIQDERFLDLIHAQYLKVAHARSNRNKSPDPSKK